MNQPSRIIIGDVLESLATLPAGSVHCCVTSPPYWGLRDYGVEGQIGLEPTPEAFIAKMVAVFAEVRRVLRDDGVCFINIGDSYASSGRSDRKESPGVGAKQAMRKPGRSLEWEAGGGHNFSWYIPTDSGKIKPKDLCMMPWRVALALQADGWWIRSVICWAKKSPMPESVTDRPTSSWEPIFLMAKSERYFYDAEAVREQNVGTPPWGDKHNFKMNDDAAQGKHGATSFMAGGTRAEFIERYYTNGRNQRNVWTLGPEPYSEAHFATFPTEIPRRAIKAGTSEKGCCPTCGAPWRRVVERFATGEKQKAADGWDTAEGAHGTIHRNGRSKGETGKDVMGSRTVGWKRTCEHDGEPVPCIVLDPFLGSGTTVAVARELGRHGIGIELNPAYAKLARRRIGKAERPNTFRDMDHETPAPLFGV